MSRVHFEVAETIDARPEVIWDILTDYREAHPSILPKAFGPLVVEEGGRGAGTIMHFSLRVAGSTRNFHQVVSTPEPGRVLVESNTDGSGETTFTLTSMDEGRRTHLRIVTEMETHGGLMGAVERALIPRLILPIYREELGKLADVAKRRSGAEV
ncbi:MAG TPA: SRPBCC family protein [Ktedonobacterales bacterium]|jgi:hypothetical protein|nr:SRPBCC family protein [Ktedonobacterales bacterium]